MIAYKKKELIKINGINKYQLTKNSMSKKYRFRSSLISHFYFTGYIIEDKKNAHSINIFQLYY